MNLIKEFLTVYEKQLGYKMPAPGREAAGAKRILDAGFTVDEAMLCYRYLKKQSWRDPALHLSLTYVASNIAAYMQEHGPKTSYDDSDMEKWFSEHNK